MFSADGGEILEDDPDDPMRTAIRQMRGVFSQLERALLVKRLRNGKQAKAAQGGYTGVGVPLGKTLDDHGGFADDPAEQAVIGRVRELRAAASRCGRCPTPWKPTGTPPRPAPSGTPLPSGGCWMSEERTMTTTGGELTIRWSWQPAGQMSRAIDGRVALPPLPTVPGVYRFTLRDAGGACIGVYIGQGAKIRKRVQHYRTPGHGQRDTKTRINGLLLAALRSGGAVQVEIATAATVRGVPRDLRAKAAREQLEDAALALARASGDPVLNGGYGAA